MEITINYLAVLVAAVLGIIIGALWYGPLFGKQWMAMMGFTKESMKAMALSPVLAMVGGAIVSLLMAYVLSHVIQLSGNYFGSADLMRGVTTAFWLWLGFAVPITGGGYLWEGKPMRLWILNAGYYLVSLIIMGAVLSVWI